MRPNHQAAAWHSLAAGVEMARMVALLALMGLVVGLLLGGADGASVHVTFLGSGLPGTASADDPGDCTGKVEDGLFTMEGDCTTALARPKDNGPPECDYQLGFRTDESRVRRLSVTVQIMRDGKPVGRGRADVESFDDVAPGQLKSRTVRGECDADHIRVVEAEALVDGALTDLVAGGAIGSRSLMPFLPDFFITIGG